MVYCQLTALKLADPIFHASNFSRLPVKLIWDILDHNSKTVQSRVNAESISTAKLGMVVVSALGGKGTKAKVSDFLPYENKETGGTGGATIDAIKWALKARRLPPQVVAMVGAELS